MPTVDEIQELSRYNPYFAAQQQTLEPLPYPVYFVTKNPKWQDVIDGTESASLEQLYERCEKTNDIWSAQVYLDLKQRGLDVRLVSKPVPGKICVIPYYYLKPQDWLYKSYVVACHHDCPHPVLCDQKIVINQSQVLDSTHHFLPHRPQPNLQPRDQSRGANIHTLVYKGHGHSLDAAFRSDAFIAEVNSLGIASIFNLEGEKCTFADWANYTESDVLLAVRNNTEFDIALKPALKLVNAWFAGCPAILGPEPAYRSLRKSPLDYIEVYTPEDAIAALKYLQANPEIYLAMIANGFQRAQEFTVDQVSLAWRNLLAGAIAEGYDLWLQESPLQKQIGRPMQYLWRTLQHKRAARHYRHAIHHGPRILTNRVINPI